MALTTGALGLLPSPLGSDDLIRKQAEGERPAMPALKGLRRRCDISTESVGGYDVVTVRPHDLPADATQLIYMHGGAFISPMAAAQWLIVDGLLKRTPALVRVPMYPLAPQHQVDDSFAFLDEVTHWCGEAEPNRSMIYTGDSAGAGLALAYAMHQRDTGARQRADALVLFDPWVDVTLTNPAIAAFEPRDPMLHTAQLRTCGQWWSGARATTDPAVSPLLGDLAGLPPVHSFAGDRELLLPDLIAMNGRIRRAGGTSTLTVAHGAFHGYACAVWTREARQALDEAAGFIASSQPDRCLSSSR
jgi:monoterpene epsilon-lactone hydrolase